MRRRPLLAAALAAVAGVLGTLFVLAGSPAGSAPRTPTLQLVPTVKETTVSRFGENPAMLVLGTYIAADHGPFELRVGRSGSGFEVIQGVSTPDGTFRFIRRLPPGSVKEIDRGLADFFELVVKDRNGRQVSRDLVPFCPGGFEHSRINDAGPDTPRYPRACPANDRTQRTVWGVDQGWAVQVPHEHQVELPDGTYDVTIRITSKYVRLFGIDPKAAAATVRTTITTEADPGPPGATRATGGHGEHGAALVTPDLSMPADGLPDLIALPAWNPTIRVEENGRDALEFAATIWNAGPGPLVVEGFRRPNQELMDAFQYSYRDGVRTGRSPVGTLEYDRRDGHHHWHFTDFARYRLLDASRQTAVRSEKEAFCLAATDPIDLTLPGASWAPDATDLHTACGRVDSVWIREVLDVGWGDTYFQSLPGQSFDITDLPNGTYHIEVTTNPFGNLHEQTRGNNTALLTVSLGGRRGARMVTVPPQ